MTYSRALLLSELCTRAHIHRGPRPRRSFAGMTTTASARGGFCVTGALASPNCRSAIRKPPPHPNELYAFDASTGRRTEVEDGDAVLRQVHLLQQVTAERDELDAAEVADEDRILEWIAVALGHLMHASQPARRADVVGQQIPRAGGQGLSSCQGPVLVDVSDERCRKHPRLDLESPPVGRSIPEYRMEQLVGHAALVAGDHALSASRRQ